MTDLIDSLRELSHEHLTIVPVFSNLELTTRHAIDTVNVRHEFRSVSILVETAGEMSGVFDAKKMERVLFNLVLNACEAISDRPGHVRVEIESSAETFEIRVADDGPGIPPSVRSTMFDPFVSSGKANGTGLGLAIVSKIVRDHNGTVLVEHTSDAGTVILVTIPRCYQPAAVSAPSVTIPLRS
jgi:signal transduction histidine kinase